MNQASHTLPPLQLKYKPDAAEAQQRMRAYWAGEMIDRPCISIRTPRAGMAQPRRSLITAPDFDFQKEIAGFNKWADCTFFGGEAMPYLHPWYGPDQWAAFVGADLTLYPEMDTSWPQPFVEDWDTLPKLAIDSDNKWWNAVLKLARLGAEDGRGKYIICSIDTHSNVDCLSAIRDPSRLCMDLIINPEGVKRAVKWVDELFKPVYDAVWEAGNMAQTGTTSWVDMYSEGRTQCLQCDFCYMVSPEHFREFMLPSLEYEASCLEHVVYHLDGVGELIHLDDILAIPNMHTIQWLPGAGQPPATEWIDVYKKIQAAGKSVQVLANVEEVKVLYHELAPEKTFYWVTGCPSEEEARGLLDWMAKQ